MSLKDAGGGIWVYLIKSRAGFEFCCYDVSCNKPQASNFHITLFSGWSLLITGFFLLYPSLSELGHRFAPAAQRGFLYSQVPLWVLLLVSQCFLVLWGGQQSSLLSWFSLRPSRMLSPEGGLFRWSWPSPCGWVLLMLSVAFPHPEVEIIFPLLFFSLESHGFVSLSCGELRLLVPRQEECKRRIISLTMLSTLFF